MKIGDRVFVRGHIDEIRKDTVIIRNAGGYFGTIPSEVTGELPSTQPEPFMVTIDHELTKDEVERLKQSMSNTPIVLFPSVQPEPQWIPCSERLPRQGQEVICQCRANMIKVLKLDACGDWYQDAEHCYMSGFVIAWMPLPEPYRAKRRTDE